MNHNPKCLSISVVLLAACLAAPSYPADDDGDGGSRTSAKRQKIDSIAGETLDELFDKAPVAKELYDKAYGYAVFDNVKISLMITGGGGRGVAVRKSDGTRTYMNMGTAGLNIGLGGQKYQIVFLFESKDRFEEFVAKGWEADASANAVAGPLGANAEATFRDGMAFYQLTQAGLMLQADISGTKYWKNKRLNR
jgi:lipid-binding SYLF domain-containing protein